MRVEPKPTKRAVIDVGRKCNISCKFCYHKHLGDLTRESFHSKEKLMDEIKQAHIRGNNYIDFTGGEPTILPYLPELIQYAKSLGMLSCVITNSLCGLNAVEKIVDAGVDQFLLSVHGTENVHNDIVGRDDAREKQIRFIQWIKERGVSYRFNCVISRYNQNELVEIAEWMTRFGPEIVNFINFNPHDGWAGDSEGTKSVVADLRLVEKQLDDAIGILESCGIGVNVRYFPMCRIAEDYRRCVCNDLHVAFDPYEWDYEILPKTVEAYLHWGMQTSKCIEFKGAPCCYCDLGSICGGINSAYNNATMGEMIECVKDSSIKDKTDFYHYRQHNIKTLQERGK